MNRNDFCIFYCEMKNTTHTPGVNKMDLAIFIIDDADFNELQGTESQVYYVFISDDFMNGDYEGFEKYSRKCFSVDAAVEYATKLSKMFPSFEYVGLM